MCFLFPLSATEVPGGNRPGSIRSTIFLSRRTPQANIRAFHSVARDRMFTFNWNMRPPHFAPICWEKGLRSLEGKTLDHPSYQQRGGRTAWQDDRHYTAAVQLQWPIPVIFHFCLEPPAIQTLLVVAAIVTKRDLFDDAHKMQDISWHWMIVSDVCVFVLLMQ